MPAPVKDNEIKRASMEKRLAQTGAKIDHLMVTADQAREEVRLRLESLKEKEKNFLLRGEEALDECKSALEKAWDELSHAWLDIKEGAEKAAQKLQPESPPDQSEQIAQHHSKNTVAEYDCFFCDRCREYIYDELKGDESRGIPPQTWVDCLPKSWQCPVCGSAAQDLRAVTLFDDFSEDEFKKSGLQEKVDASRRAAS